MGWGEFQAHMALTKEQEYLIIDSARQWAASLRLETADDFHAAVQQQLANLAGSNINKRRNTIIAMGEAAVNPEISRASIFKRKNTISEYIFYSNKKDWFQDVNFRTVLENVIALYRTWEAAKQMRVIEERQMKWREDSWRIGNMMAEVATNMLGTDLYEVLMEDGDGREVTVVPAKWAFRDVAPMVTAADKLLRLSLDMPTEKTEINAEITEAEEPRDTLRDKLAHLRVGLAPPTAVPDEEDPQEEDDEP